MNTVSIVAIVFLLAGNLLGVPVQGKDLTKAKFSFLPDDFTWAKQRSIRGVEFTYGNPERSTNDVVSGGPSSMASPMKNKVKGPTDLGIFFINSYGLSCGGLNLSQCSRSCGVLGYPLFWCEPKVCVCHFGKSNTNEVDPNENDPQIDF